MKKLLIMSILFLIVLTSCSTDSIKPKELQLRPEIIELLDNKDVEVAIIRYTESLIKEYNNRGKNNGLIKHSDAMKENYAIILEYIEIEVPSNIFSLDIPFEELDIRMSRLKKILEIQEIAALISKLNLETEGKPNKDDVFEIKERILDLLDSYFE